MNTDQVAGHVDDSQGRGKEAARDDKLKSEDRADQVARKVKGTFGDSKEMFVDAFEAI